MRNHKVIAVILLALYLLVLCTLFSCKIQEEMTILVTGYPKTSSQKTGRPITIDWRAIYTEYNAEEDVYEDHLYEVQEGYGWEQGLRCRNVNNFGINPILGLASFTMNRDTFLVMAASRNPQEGKLAKIIEEFDIGEDMYLYYYPSNLPPDREFPQNITVLGETDHVILTSVTDANFPFLPHTAKTWTITTDYAKKVYSLIETELFLKQIPLVMAIFILAASGILFWIFGYMAGIWKNGRIVWLNIFAACIALIALVLIFRYIDLPASLLPGTNIFDLTHYQEELSLIFNALQNLEMTDHSIFHTLAQVKNQCSQLAFGFCITTICVLVLETFYIFFKHPNIEKLQKM